MSAKNKVIAGDYSGKMIFKSFGTACLSLNLINSIELNKSNVKQ